MNNECGSLHPTLEDVWCERPAHHQNMHLGYFYDDLGYFYDGQEWVSVVWTSQNPF